MLQFFLKPTSFLFSNSVRQLLSRRFLKVFGWSGGSKLGASSASRLHSLAYIDEYFGSSNAFLNICKTTNQKNNPSTSRFNIPEE